MGRKKRKDLLQRERTKKRESCFKQEEREKEKNQLSKGLRKTNILGKGE